jgi:hypothetical protein
MSTTLLHRSATEPAASAAAPPARPRLVGPIAPILLLAAVGVLLVAVANARSAAAAAPPPWLFWGGVLLIVVPITFRLTSTEPSASERAFLLCVLGLALYALKVSRDPFMHTYPDEFVHDWNAIEIARSGQLFRDNPLLPVTPYFPGLEAATAALMSLTGMSVFAAGVVVVGVGRVMMMLGLFVLFRAISGSARAAGLGVAVYVGQANFLFFSAQYSYESIALPLAVTILVAVAYWVRSPQPAFEVVVAVGLAAVAVTHHLTSYALVAALLALAVVFRLMRRRQEDVNPWPFLVLAGVLVVLWFIAIRGAVFDYLRPVIVSAFEGVRDTVSGTTAPRKLFERQAGSTTGAPVTERYLSFASVLVLFAGLLLGLRQVWRSHRSKPFAILFALAGLAYFGALGLRFASESWEIGNRASAYTFIGLGFVIGCAGIERWKVRGRPIGRPLATSAIALVVVGGVILGWPSEIRLSQPLYTAAQGRVIPSEPVGLARWAGTRLPDGRFAASVGDARVLLSQGPVYALGGTFPDVQDILRLPFIQKWQLELLRREDLRYVVVDRRLRSGNNDLAPWFTVQGEPEPLLPQGVVRKFEDLGWHRIYDSGNIVVFDREAPE